MGWIVRHIGWSYSRFQPQHDGHTPFRNLYGYDYTKPTLPIGEKVKYKVDGVENQKLAVKWKFENFDIACLKDSSIVPDTSPP